MKKIKLPTIVIFIILIGGIISLDISRRYLSGEFETNKSTLEFLYSSEKAGWLESVVSEFEKEWKNNNSGKNINVIMTPIGTGKGTLQVANTGSKPTVWSPASRFWLPILNRLWRTNNDADIVDIQSPSLVISPTIIATWKSFQEENNITGFEDLRRLAITDSSFTFAHTDPFESNSGFSGVIMAASVAAGKNPEELNLDDLAKDDVQQWMRELESAAIQYGSSTGFLAKLMASGGPSKLKAALIYENLVVEKNNELKDEKLVAVYPVEGTLLNDHPYAILDAPWVTEKDKQLAEDFLGFLLKTDIQTQAIEYGFRPSVNLVSSDLLDEKFSEEAGVRKSLDGLKIYSVEKMSGEILERIPDLWTATRSRSLGSEGDAIPKLEPKDFIMPVVLGVIILMMLFSPFINKFRRYYS